jgi:hypothetical protein
VEPESTTTISSAQAKDLQASPMFVASLKAIMVAEIFIRFVNYKNAIARVVP